MDINHNSEIGDQKLEEVVYKPSKQEGKIQQLKSNNVTKKGDTFFLYFSALTANILIFNSGCQLVWTSPVIPQLKSNNLDINPLGAPISTLQVSLLAGIPTLFGISGTICLGKMADLIGRKNTLMCMSLGILLASTVAASWSHIYVYYVTRSIIMLCIGLVYAVQPIYLNEICEDHNRAKHGCIMMLLLPMGNLYTYLVGSVTTVRVLTLLCGLPSIIHLVFFYLLVPESPFYTASKGDEAATMKTLRMLRNNKSFEEIEEDYRKIQASLKSRVHNDKAGFMDLFKSPALRKGFIVGLGINLAPQISGVTIIMQMMGPLVNDADTNLSGNTVAIFAGTLKLCTFFLTIVMVGKLSRRTLLLFSSLFSGIPLSIFGLYFFLKQIGSPIVESIKWLPIACVLVYIFAFSLGLGSIPVTVLSELFPNEFRSVASSCVLTIVSCFAFVLATAFPMVSKTLGTHYCLWFFSICCFSSCVFIYYMLPETKGKSFVEIQKILSK